MGRIFLLALLLSVPCASSAAHSITVTPSVRVAATVKKPMLLGVPRHVLRPNTDNADDDDDEVLVDSVHRPRELPRSFAALPARIRERLALARYLAILRTVNPALHTHIIGPDASDKY